MAFDDLVAHVKMQAPFMQMVEETPKPRVTIVHPSKSEQFLLPHYPIRDTIQSPYVPPAGGTAFSVLSYNILADCYAHSAGYWYSSSLSAPLRHESLMREIAAVGYGSVICFQEVTEQYFSSRLLPSLRGEGYGGVFQQKSKRHRTGARSEDGVATFYNIDKCVLIAQQPVVLNELMESVWKHKFGNNGMADTCYRDTVALLTAFSIEGKIVSIANVHIHFDWTRTEVQTLQSCLVLRKLVEFANTNKSCAYLYCGDFNSQPSTAVYQLLTAGVLTAEMKDLFMRSSALVPVRKTELLLKTTTDFVPYFELFRDLYQVPDTVKSAYLTVQGHEPHYTNYTGDFHGCLDYIFYGGRVYPYSVLSLPTERDLRSEVALPNSVMSSDHMSVKAGFVISS